MPGNPYEGRQYGYCGGGYGYCGTPASGAALLLDNLPQFRIAVATKKLRTAYSGDCFQVRESGGSTTDNFGFVNGEVDSASYDTFCGANSGYLAAWRDQSGSGNDIAQATTTVQPRVVGSGTVDVNGSGQVGVFGASESGSAWYIDSGALTYTRPYHRFCVVTFNSDLNSFLWDGQQNNRGNLDANYSAPDYRVRAYDGAGLYANVSTGTRVGVKAIIEVLYNGASSRVRVNDNAAVTGNLGTGTMPSKVRLMNAGATTTFGFLGWYHAFLDFDGELTTEQVTAVREGLNALYGVY